MKHTLIALLLAGCTTIDPHTPVAEWPSLRITEHHVPHAEMRSRCVRYAPPGMSPDACAEFFFDEGECHLWFSQDFPPAPYVVEHERLHCRGYEHVGETVMCGFLQNWQRSRNMTVSSCSSSSIDGPGSQ